MSDLLKSLQFSAAAMRAQAMRIRTVSENISNADTPGFHRKVTNFKQSTDGLVEVGKTRLDQSELTRVFDPGHPLADETGYYNGSNVDLIIEVADAREAQRSYEANLKIFDQARQMAQSLFELIRR